jgi:uncharacterized membrane protein
MSLLLLFSSNQRPLYEQDILDVLAAPQGARYVFRYEKRYVDDNALAQWDNLRATPVLVLFSVQQEQYYQPPAYVPVREGSVVSARMEGDICFVEFSIGAIVTLPRPLYDGNRMIYEDPVRALASVIDELPSPGFKARPQRKSASLVDETTVPITALAEIPQFAAGEPVLVGPKDQVQAFRVVADYLSHTASFRSAQFLCFYQFNERKSGRQLSIVDGIFRLSDNADYELVILQMQPREVAGRTTFTIGSAEEVLKVIGVPEFDIASRYDLISVPLHAVPLNEEVRETVLTVAPKFAKTQGPRLRLRLRIARHPSPITAAGAAGLLLLAGLPGAFGDVPKMAIVMLGAVIAFALFYFGWVRVTGPRG